MLEAVDLAMGKTSRSEDAKHLPGPAPILRFSST